MQPAFLPPCPPPTQQTEQMDVLVPLWERYPSADAPPLLPSDSPSSSAMSTSASSGSSAYSSLSSTSSSPSDYSSTSASTYGLAPTRYTYFPRPAAATSSALLLPPLHLSLNGVSPYPPSRLPPNLPSPDAFRQKKGTGKGKEKEGMKRAGGGKSGKREGKKERWRAGSQRGADRWERGKAIVEEEREEDRVAAKDGGVGEEGGKGGREDGVGGEGWVEARGGKWRMKQVTP